MKKAIITVMAMSAALMFFGCEGRKLVGEWQEIDNPNHTVLIERNNSNYLMTETKKGTFGESVEGPTPGTCQDGVITFPAKFGTSPTAFIDNKTGHLILQKGVGPFSTKSEFERKKK